MKRLKSVLFLAALLAAFFAADLLTNAIMPSFFARSGRFYLDDFEVVQRDHPEEVWDKVFFGNSVVISGFREDESSSGYINLGLDCGVVTDLWEMLKKGEITVGSDLVIGLNSLTLYDDFETNAHYQWHRKWYEPYIYFERDRLKQLFEETVKTPLGFQPAYDYYGQGKIVYYGAMSTEEILEHRSTEHYLPLLELTEADYRENLRALEEISEYCMAHSIRLRLVWLPANPIITPDNATVCAYELAKAFSRDHNIELYDMTNMLDSSCFYDGGHLNYQYGSYVFTEVIDPWLNG